MGLPVALSKIRRVTDLRYVERFPAADKPGPAGQGVSLEASRASHSRFPSFRPKICFFIVKSIFEIVKMIRRKFPKFSYM